MFCVEEIKYSLLGRGCMVPGLCTLLCQLFIKREYKLSATEKDDSCCGSIKGCFTVQSAEGDVFNYEELFDDTCGALRWDQEWALGSSYDLYQIDAIGLADGMLFKDFASWVYEEFNCLPIGVEFPPDEQLHTSHDFELTSSFALNRGTVALAPLNYQMKGKTADEPGDSIIMLCIDRFQAEAIQAKVKSATKRIEQDNPSLGAAGEDMSASVRLAVIKKCSTNVAPPPHASPAQFRHCVSPASLLCSF